MWVTATVTTKPAVRATGRITLRDRGAAIKTVMLRATHRNRVRMRMPRLSVGVHKINISYDGSPRVLASTTGTATVRVRR